MNKNDQNGHLLLFLTVDIGDGAIYIGDVWYSEVEATKFNFTSIAGEPAVNWECGSELLSLVSKNKCSSIYIEVRFLS